MDKAQIKAMIDRIIGGDEPFAHDTQTSSCFCHKPEQLFAQTNQRNLVRGQQRQRANDELARLSDATQTV